MKYGRRVCSADVLTPTPSVNHLVMVLVVVVVAEVVVLVVVVVLEVSQCLSLATSVSVVTRSTGRMTFVVSSHRFILSVALQRSK